MGIFRNHSCCGKKVVLAVAFVLKSVRNPVGV